MDRQTILLAIYIGLTSGILLGLFLKLIEKITGILVYTLLLNIDFIPGIESIKWAESLEFFFHVLVSILISFVFVYLVIKLQIGQNFKKLLGLSFLLCIPTFALFFILSLLAIKEVPAWNDWDAFGYWTLTHLFYVWLVATLYIKLSPSHIDQ
ncbi:MAG: hypothetical protein ABWX61_02875 [Paenisporosarcina sp.]